MISQNTHAVLQWPKARVLYVAVNEKGQCPFKYFSSIQKARFEGAKFHKMFP